jgi:hypothetical protein
VSRPTFQRLLALAVLANPPTRQRRVCGRSIKPDLPARYPPREAPTKGSVRDLKIAERRWSATAAQGLVLYQCANAEATRSAPGKGRKLKSKPALLAEAPELLSQDCRHLAEPRHAAPLSSRTLAQPIRSKMDQKNGLAPDPLDPLANKPRSAQSTQQSIPTTTQPRHALPCSATRSGRPSRCSQRAWRSTIAAAAPARVSPAPHGGGRV